MAENLEDHFPNDKRVIRSIRLNHFSRIGERLDESGETAEGHIRQTPLTPLPDIIDTGSDIPVTPWPNALQEGANVLASIEERQLSADLYAPFFSLLAASGRFIDEEPTWLMLPAVYPGAPSVRVREKVPTKTREAGAEEQNSASLIRNLIKSSGIYALASIASPFISLVLAPFLTRSLTHGDYGILAVLNTIIALG